MGYQKDSRPIAVFGKAGQLGGALLTLLQKQAIGFTHQELDLTDFSNGMSVLNKLNPRMVINAAAYTQVDRAESEAGLALAINAIAPGKLAQWCAGRNIPFIHFSTDYVFPGTGKSFWMEEDETNPLNIYGKSKLEGEKRVAASGASWLIFRTSWVYNAFGKNFLTTILDLAKTQEDLRVVNDQWGAPTYAPQLAEAVVTALNNVSHASVFPTGIYHLCHQGETTWYEFTLAILKKAAAKKIPFKLKTLTPVPSSAFHCLAKRPLNSRLSTAKAESVLGVKLPDWRQGLETCMNNLP